MAFGQIESLRLADHVYLSLRTAILHGELPPGAELLQEQLATQFGISRTPLREALHRLALEGFVEARTHRSAVVAAVSPADTKAAYEARIVVETAAARLAAARREAAAIAALEEAVAKLAAAGDDFDLQLEANRRFHVALVEAAGNPHLSRFIAELWDGRIVPLIYARQARMPERAEVDALEHGEIARLIAAGDADGAARAVERHLDNAFEALRGDGRAAEPQGTARPQV